MCRTCQLPTCCLERVLALVKRARRSARSSGWPLSEYLGTGAITYLLLSPTRLSLPAMNVFRTICILCAASLLTGCSSLADGADSFAGLGSVSEEKSTFNGATILRMQPAWVYGGSWLTGAAPVKVGAYWTSEKPDQVALVLRVDGNINAGNPYLNLFGLDVNVGGKIQSFQAAPVTSFDSSNYNTVSKTIYTSSTNGVVIPLTLFREMVTGPHCRIRFQTGRGYEEADFAIERSDAGGASARHYAKGFLQRVDAVRSGRAA